METPYQGRATIQDNITDLQITIPAKRNWLIIIFIGAWLGGWLMGEIAVPTLMLQHVGPGSLFIIFWLIAWTAGGFMAFRFFLWNLSGREVITIGQGALTIEKKGALLVKPKTYDLKEVRNIRAQEDAANIAGPFGGYRRNGFLKIGDGGTIRFDYGLQTVKFANGIDEAEARFILDKMKSKGLIAD